MKNLITSFNDFVNESYMMTNESSTSEGGAKISPIGDTGISLVTFPKDTSFSTPDNKPYILILSDSVEFQSFMDNKTVTVELTPDDMELKSLGVWKREHSSKEKSDLNANPTGKMIGKGKTPDIKSSVEILEAAVGALYGTYGVKKENISKLVKAMRIMIKEYELLLSKNSIFTNLFKNIVKINNMKSAQDLVTSMGGNKTSYTAEIFDGVKLGFKA
jgi:hypothetical protein